MTSVDLSSTGASAPGETTEQPVDTAALAQAEPRQQVCPDGGDLPQGNRPLGDLAYQPETGLFDEMVGPDGTIRPHWQTLEQGLKAIGAEGMNRRWERGKRLLRANGVTYNVYGDPSATVRQWRLDPVPMVIDGREWQGLEKAIEQRAALLNHILDDIYGPQSLLRAGLLPPALVHANPAFMRPLVGARPRGQDHGPCLHFYAADLARSPDGVWWVTGDRAEAPSGAGYALENRSIVSRVLPDLYRQCGVERLAPWFAKVRETLAARAPLNRDNPRIVLLTPGPYNETWFEHSYLARTLGLLLVEGEDLTVRDGRVMLKTTDGLKPVDVILRRTDGAYCDPLELRGDSTLGVPGLVEAIHRQTVAVCNGLGSAVVESPAMMAFLPSLSRAILGQDLLMPSVATWWCGQKRELDYVIQNLDRLALRPAFSQSSTLIRGALLSAEEREKWVARLRHAPTQWVAQEAVDLSTAPEWSDGASQARPVVMRAHCVADQDGYSVMPGGLTRTGVTARELSVSMQQGGGSKDTWILSVPTDSAGGTAPLGDAHSAPLSPPGSVTPRQAEGTGSRQPNLQGIEPRVFGQSASARPLVISRGQVDLPSRVADNMFWLGRYLERCENTCRLLRAVLTRALAGPDAAAELTVALSLFQRMAHLPLTLDISSIALGADQTEVAETGDEAEADGPYSQDEAHHTAVHKLLTVNLDPGVAHALAGTIQNLQRVSMVARDRLSNDTWRTLGGLPARLQAIGEPDALDLDDAASALDEIITTLSALSGLSQESMTRGLGWRFMDIGRRVERGLHLLDLLDATQLANSVSVSAALELALDVSDSQMTYRARYPSVPRFLPTLDLLLADETNPRSLGFQVERLMEHMEMLSPDRVHKIFTAEHRLVISIQATVRTLSLDRVHPRGQQGVTIDAVTATVREDLYSLVDALMRRYFVHAAEQRHPHRIALVHPKPKEPPVGSGTPGRTGEDDGESVGARDLVEGEPVAEGGNAIDPTEAPAYVDEVHDIFGDEAVYEPETSAGEQPAEPHPVGEGQGS